MGKRSFLQGATFSRILAILLSAFMVFIFVSCSQGSAGNNQNNYDDTTLAIEKAYEDLSALDSIMTDAKMRAEFLGVQRLEQFNADALMLEDSDDNVRVISINNRDAIASLIKYEAEDRDLDKSMETLGKQLKSARKNYDKNNSDKANSQLELAKHEAIDATEIYNKTYENYNKLKSYEQESQANLQQVLDTCDSIDKDLEKISAILDNAKVNLNDEKKHAEEYEEIIKLQQELAKMQPDDVGYDVKADRLVDLELKRFSRTAFDIKDHGQEIKICDATELYTTDYKKDDDGKYLTDKNGEYIPVNEEVKYKLLEPPGNVEGIPLKFTYIINSNGTVDFFPCEIKSEKMKLVLCQGEDKYISEQGKEFKEGEGIISCMVDESDPTMGLYATDKNTVNEISREEIEVPQLKEENVGCKNEGRAILYGSPPVFINKYYSLTPIEGEDEKVTYELDEEGLKEIHTIRCLEKDYEYRKYLKRYMGYVKMKYAENDMAGYKKYIYDVAKKDGLEIGNTNFKTTWIGSGEYRGYGYNSYAILYRNDKVEKDVPISTIIYPAVFYSFVPNVGFISKTVDRNIEVVKETPMNVGLISAQESLSVAQKNISDGEKLIADFGATYMAAQNDMNDVRRMMAALQIVPSPDKEKLENKKMALDRINSALAQTTTIADIPDEEVPLASRYEYNYMIIIKIIFVMILISGGCFITWKEFIHRH